MGEISLKSVEELNVIKQKALEKVNLNVERESGTRIVVGMATCGIAAGAGPVLGAFADGVKERQLEDVTVVQTGCIGVCRLEPIVEVYMPGEEKVTYVKMAPEKAARVIDEHIMNGSAVMEYTIGAEE
jgi:NADP-reducing hydrogenase subunit HndB